MTDRHGTHPIYRPTEAELAALKARAADRGCTVTDVIRGTLADALAAGDGWKLGELVELLHLAVEVLDVPAAAVATRAAERIQETRVMILLAWIRALIDQDGKAYMGPGLSAVRAHLADHQLPETTLPAMIP